MGGGGGSSPGSGDGVPDGDYHPGSKFAESLGFTLNNFEKEGWITKSGNTIWIEQVMAKTEGGGEIHNMFTKILNKGYEIKLTNVISSRFRAILRHYEFKEYKPVFGKTETDIIFSKTGTLGNKDVPIPKGGPSQWG